MEEKRIKEWLNENECTTLVEGLYLLCNGLCLLLLYYNQMIIMPMNLLDCICLDNKRMIDEKEEIIEGMGLLVDVYGLDNGLLFDGNLGLLVKGLDPLLNGQMLLLGRHHFTMIVASKSEANE